MPSVLALLQFAVSTPSANSKFAFVSDDKREELIGGPDGRTLDNFSLDDRIGDQELLDALMGKPEVAFGIAVQECSAFDIKRRKMSDIRIVSNKSFQLGVGDRVAPRLVEMQREIATGVLSDFIFARMRAARSSTLPLDGSRFTSS